ncbi:MAG: TlpA disulfide reductase family protein [Thermaerobacter sp.]|nr:TlpA disulfide reductase family protein [Thermaerobacter sp.]
MANIRSAATAVVLAGAVGYAGFLVGGAIHRPQHVAATVSTSPAAPSSASAVPQAPSGLQPGDLAPNFTLKTTTGQTVSLASLRGHPVWLNFWATWCTWCQKEIPIVEKFQTAYHGKLDIYGVDVQEPVSKVTPYMVQKKMNYPVLLDSQGAVAAGYGVQGLPTSAFISPTGKIVYIYVGAFLSYAQANVYVQKALAAQ